MGVSFRALIATTLVCLANVEAVVASASEVSRLSQQQISKVSLYLDDGEQLRFELRVSRDSKGAYYLQGNSWREIAGAPEYKTLLPNAIVSGVEIIVDSRALKLVHAGPTETGPHSTDTIEISPKSMVSLRVYGHPLATFSVNQGQISTSGMQKKISRFDMRSAFSLSPSLVQEGFAANQVIADLHTHFVGAIRTSELFDIAEKLRLPYPTELLRLMGLTWRESAVFRSGSRDVVPFSRENISFAVINGYGKATRSLGSSFEISPEAVEDFDKLDLAYKVRGPIARSIEAFPLLLRSIAADYSRTGVKYAELSFGRIAHPDYLMLANKLIPELEREFGVQLRFLASIRRQKTGSDMDSEIALTIKAMRLCPYVVGVDFMGRETNPTTDFAAALSVFKGLKSEFPHMAIRVHAGENANNPDNILNAIRLGATRIGHGIYGINDETLRLARERDVIIEFNFNSNLALGNVTGLEEIKSAVKRYRDAGVRVTLATDGHGVFRTSTLSEVAVARSAGMGEGQLREIRESDQRYIQKMSAAVEERRRSFHIPRAPLCRAIFSH